MELVATGRDDAECCHDAHNGHNSSAKRTAKACWIVSETVAQDIDVA